MLIYCPKCNSCYDVDDALILVEGRKLRCSKCKEVFRFDKNGSDATAALQSADERKDYNEPAQNENTDIFAENDDNKKNIAEEAKEEITMQDIFERLNEQSDKLFQEEQNMPRKQRFILQIKTILGLNRKFNFKIIGLLCFAVLAVAAYNYRYDVVRKVPFTNRIYKTLGIRAKIPGEGLEFQNVNWNYVDDDGRKILEVKGFINNPSKKEIEIPVVHVELLDEKSQLLQSINQKPTVTILKPESRVAVRVVVNAPSPTAKYVYMTFIDMD